MEIKKQDDIKDCGLTILQAFHAHFYNRWININQFKKKASYGPKGVNVEGICSIGKAYGMKIVPMKGSFDSLKELIIKKPLIALIGNESENHYIVITKISKKAIYFLDPITGNKESLSFERFEPKFLNVIMNVEKTQYTHKEIKIKSLYEYIFQFKKIIPIILISTVISIVITFSSSFFMKVIMDQIIPGALNNTLIALFSGFITIGILGVFNKTFRKYIVYKISLQISIEITEKFNNKIMESEFIEISKLSKADIIRRTTFIEPLSIFLSSVLFSIFSELVTCIVASIILVMIDGKLFFMAIITAILLIFSTLSVQTILNKKYGPYIKSQVAQGSCNMDILNSLKNTRNPDFKEFMSIKQTNALYNFKKQDKTIWNINNCYGLIQGLIRVVAPLVVILMATHNVIFHKMSIGSLILFISMFSFFIDPTCSLTDIVIKLPLVRKEMNMLSYVLELPNEKINPKGTKLEKIKEIRLKNVFFGYEAGKEMINIENYSITEDLILIGENGSGKSTLLDIISTFIHVKGVYFNEIETKYYSLHNIRGETFLINPNTHIAKMSVIEYITKNDSKRTEEFIKNVKHLKLNKILEEANVSIDMNLLNNASNVSSGQRQLIQLLPLFSKQYKLILLDEAFENIDKKITGKIIRKIKQYQKEALFIEISHSKNFVKNGKEVSIETFK